MRRYIAFLGLPIPAVLASAAAKQPTTGAGARHPSIGHELTPSGAAGVQP